MNGPRPEEELLQVAREAVKNALKAGADSAEAYLTSSRSVDVSFEKSDIRSSSSEEETFLGLRLFKKGCLGFAATNRLSPEGLAQACKEALALAGAGLSDPHNILPGPEAPSASTQKPLGSMELWSDQAARLSVEEVTDRGSAWLGQALALDSRLTVDSGSFGAGAASWALVNSMGVERSCRASQISGSIFGMAVEKGEPGSFAYDWFMVRNPADLEEKSRNSAGLFAKKCLGALGARKGEAFRGPAILDPEVVLEILVAPLLYGMDASAVRKGRSPLASSLDKAVASSHLSVEDLGADPRGPSASPFDREGLSRRPTKLVEGGILKTFLYNCYEASAAGKKPTGHAAGGPRSIPGIGPGLVRVRRGPAPADSLPAARAVYVTRFSGQADPISGEVSGVVKGGFLIKNGEKIPIQETLMHGKLDEMLKNVSAVGNEERLNGDFLSPEVRVEDVEFSTG